MTEGHTKEQPAPEELGEPGTPGAAAAHAADTQEHGHDEHGHHEATLGPIDWKAWAVALIGGASGALVLLLFWVAVS